MKKNQIIAVVVLVVAAVLVWVLRSQFIGKPPRRQVQSPPKQAQEGRVEKQDLQTTLSAFPAGFPMEPDTQKAYSYKYIPPQPWQEQSTLQYVSKKSLADNAKIFRDYLTKNGFTISARSEETDFVFYYAKKGIENLAIKINAQARTVTVSASYFKR